MYLSTLPDGTGQKIEVTTDEFELLEIIREKIRIGGHAEVRIF